MKKNSFGGTAGLGTPICNLAASVILGLLFVFPQINVAQDRPLNLDQVETTLQSTKAPAAVRIKLLIEGVNERKTTFLVTPEIEKRLKLMGATAALIAALKSNEPASRVLNKTSSNTTVKNSSGIELVLIPKGEFMMGTGSARESDRFPVFDNQRPQHKVVIGQDFFIGKYEITQAQWLAVMGKNPSFYTNCSVNCPVETVSWNDVHKFIDKVNQKSDGFKYRLPSEAEWEYAARAGTSTTFYWGDDPSEKDFMFYASSNHSNPVRVGSFLPNGFGLYDMAGNVWELTEDAWQDSYKSTPVDGSPNLKGNDPSRKIMRGGSYVDVTDERRSDMRRFSDVDQGNYSLGFRLVATTAK